MSALRGAPQVASERDPGADAAVAGQEGEKELFWRSLYLPEQGMFCAAPADLQLGSRLPVRYIPLATPLAASLPLLPHLPFYRAAPADLQLGSRLPVHYHPPQPLFRCIISLA